MTAAGAPHVTEVAENAFAIRTEMEGPADPWMFVYLIRDEQNVLIDTGVAGAPTKFVIPALRHLGMEPSDIALVLATHGHMDHIGGNAEVSAWGAQIKAHRLDRPRIESADYHVDHAAFGLAAWDRLDLLEVRERRLRTLLGDVVGASEFIEDGDILDLGSRRIAVRHLPGHTPGSVCYELVGESVFVTGDTVQGLCTQHRGEMPIVEEPGFYRTSMNRLLDRHPEALLMAHPFRGLAGQLGPSAVAKDAEQILVDSLAVDALLRQAALTVVIEGGRSRAQQAAAMVTMLTPQINLTSSPNGLPVNSVVSVPAYLAWAAGEATRPW